MKKIVRLVLISSILGLFLSPLTKTSPVEADSMIPLSDGVPVNGTVTKDSLNSYTFTTDEDGELYVKLEQETAPVDLELYDSNGKLLPSTYEQNLPQGTYTLKVLPDSNQASWSTITSATYRMEAVYPGAFTRDSSSLEPNDTFETAFPITSAQYYSSTFDSASDRDKFAFTTNKDGEIYITIDQTTDGVDASLYDENGEFVDGLTGVQGGQELAYTHKLKQGTYYLVMEPGSSKNLANSNYRFKVTYPSINPRNPSTLEPNDTIDTAYLITEGVTYHSSSDTRLDRDIYSFVNEKDGTINIDLTNVTAGPYYLDIYDINGNMAPIRDVETKGNNVSLSEWLTKGTYYIKIDPNWVEDASGTYSVKESYLGNTPIVYTKVTDQSTFISGIAESNSTVDAYVGSSNIGTTSSGTNGEFEMNIPKQKAGSVINFSSINSNGIKSPSKSITVIDKTPPEAPTINPVSDQSTKITGTSEPGSTVFPMVGGHLIRSVVAANGKYSITISKQKAGTTINIYAVDSSGNKSTTSRIKVYAKPPVPTPTVNAVSDHSTAITGSETTHLKVYAYLGKKLLGEATSSNGRYSIKMTKQKAGSTINVYGVDSSGDASRIKSVKVLDKTPPGTPTVNKVTSKIPYVSGKAEKYATIYVYKGSHQVGTGKVNIEGLFSVRIKSQKRGYTLKVYAVDSSKNWSTPKYVKVQ